jgi:hypothetical protein
MQYPAITKEHFYSKYDVNTYKFIPNCYNEKDDSILIYRDELLREKILVFQLVDIGKDWVPEHRKNLYYLPVEDHTRLGENMKLNQNKNKKISAQLLVKFKNPYEEDINIINKKVPDITNTAIELGFCPFLTKSFEHLVYSANDKDKQIKHLNEAKLYIDKKLNQIKRAKL